MPVALVGAIGLWIVLSGVGVLALNLSPGDALVFGLAATILHTLSELWHHLGHAWAARRTGYPMTGIRFGFLGILATSMYPPNEPKLPAGIHLRRALGGPVWSLLATIGTGALALAIRSSGGLPWLLAMFAFLENLIFYTLQVFVPLGFNDGATLWKWLRSASGEW